MKNKKVGLWLDRTKAVIVSINNIEAKRIITSDMEQYAPYSKTIPGDGSPEDIRDVTSVSGIISANITTKSSRIFAMPQRFKFWARSG